MPFTLQIRVLLILSAFMIRVHSGLKGCHAWILTPNRLLVLRRRRQHLLRRGGARTRLRVLQLLLLRGSLPVHSPTFLC